MNLFWLLSLAHLMGDFPFQTDKVFYYKRNFRWGGLFHVAICTFFNILLTLPFLKLRYFWLLLLILSVSHFLYDELKTWFTKKVMRDNIFLFLLDQTLHFFTIWVVVQLFSILHPFPSVAKWSIYTNTSFIVRLSGFVFVTFATAPIIFYLQNYFSYRRKQSEKRNFLFPKDRVRLLGYVERACAIIVFVRLNPYFWVLVPVIFVPRLIKQKSEGIIEASLGLFFAVATGIAIRYLVRV